MSTGEPFNFFTSLGTWAPLDHGKGGIYNFPIMGAMGVLSSELNRCHSLDGSRFEGWGGGGGGVGYSTESLITKAENVLLGHAKCIRGILANLVFLGTYISRTKHQPLKYS